MPTTRSRVPPAVCVCVCAFHVAGCQVQEVSMAMEWLLKNMARFKNICSDGEAMECDAKLLVERERALACSMEYLNSALSFGEK